KPALIDGPTGRVLTYGELASSVRRVAAGLAGRGFHRGDVFGLFCPNVPEFAVAYLAVASLGGISTTVNSLYTADEVAYQLKDSGARFLLTVGTFLDRALDAAGRTGIEEVFVLGEGGGATPFADLSNSAEYPPEVTIDPDQDVA